MQQIVFVLNRYLEKCFIYETPYLSFYTYSSLQIKSNKLQVVVTNENENILTMGVENHLAALIESTPVKDVVLTTNNGTIKKEYSGEFFITPQQVGLCKINVCKILKRDTLVIGTKEFRVHPLPDPVARIAGLAGGIIKKTTAVKMGGIIAKLECCGFDFPVTITEFTLISTRDSTITGISKNPGYGYNESSAALLNRLQTQ